MRSQFEQPVPASKKSGNGYRGQNDPRLHFGLGAQQTPVSVELRWPDGRVEHFSDLPVDRYLTLTYGSGQP